MELMRYTEFISKSFANILNIADCQELTRFAGKKKSALAEKVGRPRYHAQERATTKEVCT